MGEKITELLQASKLVSVCICHWSNKHKIENKRDLKLFLQT